MSKTKKTAGTKGSKKSAANKAKTVASTEAEDVAVSEDKGKNSSKTDDAAVSGKKVATFAVVGAALTVLDFLVYNIVLKMFYGGDANGIGVASVVSGVIAMVAAYFAHKNITWKARKPRKYGVAWFFGWNIFAVTIVRPIVTWIFGLVIFNRLYEFAFSILSFFNMPFSYEFVNSTGVYVLMTGVIMVLNYLFYEKLVFGETKKK